MQRQPLHHYVFTTHDDKGVRQLVMVDINLDLRNASKAVLRETAMLTRQSHGIKPGPCQCFAFGWCETAEEQQSIIDEALANGGIVRPNPLEN